MIKTGLVLDETSVTAIRDHLPRAYLTTEATGNSLAFNNFDHSGKSNCSPYVKIKMGIIRP